MATEPRAPKTSKAKAAAGEPLGPVGKLRAFSTAANRSRIASRAGMSFNGDRDLFAALGYKRALDPQDYRDRYRRNGIAAQVVAAAPKATWRGGAELIEDPDPETLTKFEAAWNELQSRLGVLSILARADILAGMSRFSVVLIGAPGEMDTDLPKKLKPDQIAYLAPYAEGDVTIDTWENDTANPRYGLPLTYNFKRFGSEEQPNVGSGVKKVHWTRIIHIAENILDERVFGIPRMEPVWNYLDDLEKVTGGGAEAFWLRVNQGLIVKVDPEAEFTTDDDNRLKETMDEYVHKMRRTLTLFGGEVQPLGTDVSNFNQQVDAILTLISGSCGIPKRILMGSERGELASTQDRENWEQKITDRRRDFAEPQIVRQLVKRLMECGALPTVKSYEVRWPEIESLTEAEQATIATAWAGLNQLAGGAVVMPEEIRDLVLRLPPLEPEQVEQAEETVRATPASGPDAAAASPAPALTPGAPAPKPAPTDTPGGQSSAGIALNLNGAQIASATDIIAKVVAGELPRDSGLAMLHYLFGLDQAACEAMMGSAGTDEPTTPNPTPAGAEPAGGAPPPFVTQGGAE